jgi:hypothetical protein
MLESCLESMHYLQGVSSEYRRLSTIPWNAVPAGSRGATLATLINHRISWICYIP